MEDVIFAGTAGRPPLGRAEVTLTIDNSDGALPIDYTEVSITRRMFRSGESEYEINGDTCRLLDIQELLSRLRHRPGDARHRRAGPARRRAAGQAGGPARLHRGGGRRPQAPQAQGEGAAQAGRDAGQPDPADRPDRRAAPPAQAAGPAGRGRPPGRRRPGRPARRPAAAARRRPGRRCDDAGPRGRRRDARCGSGATEVERAWPRPRPGRPSWRRRSPPTRRLLARAQETWYRLSALAERFRGTARLAARAAPAPVRGSDDARPGRDPDELEAEAAEVRGQEEALREALEADRARLAEAVDRAAGAGAAAGRGGAGAGRRGRARWPTAARGWPGSAARSTRPAPG